jgi:predicted permease
MQHSKRLMYTIVDMLADLRFALRSIRRAPAFFVLAVGTLGLGIAAATAVFSLFYQVLLRSLPVSDPGRLVVFDLTGPTFLPGGDHSDSGERPFSDPMYTSLRERLHSFSGLASRSSSPVAISADGATEQSRAEVVSGNFFDVLGLHPALGRLIGSQDDTIHGGNAVAVLSYETWTQRFGASPSVLNRTIAINGLAFTVIGVAPAGFHGVMTGRSSQVYVPRSMKIAITPGWDEGSWGPNNRWMNIIGRLGPGVTRERALAEVKPMFFTLLDSHLSQLQHVTTQDRARLARLLQLELRPGSQGMNELERAWGRPLQALLAMALLLLLIACANLASLLLARSANRSRELAIRIAVGAARGEILRLVFTESAVIGFAGALVGFGLAPVLTAALLRFLPQNTGERWLSATVNWPMLGFSALAMIAAVVLFGLAPAFESAKAGTRSFGERTHSGGGHTRARKVAIAAQVAFSLTLLSIAGLFGRSLENLMRLQPGYRADHLLTFTLNPGLSGYSVDRGLRLYRELANRLAGQPGVETAAWAFAGPLAGSESSTNVHVEGYTESQGEDMDSDSDAVSLGYFASLGTRVLDGREFNDRDRREAAKVAVVNQAFARRFFRGADPVGRHIAIGGSGPLDIEIVGLVEDQRDQKLRNSPKPEFYVPYEQSLGNVKQIRRAMFYVRTSGGLDALTASIRPIVKQLASVLPVTDLRSMKVQVANSIYPDRLLAALASAFGALALILTAVGLYSIIAFLVSHRTSEIGIRMALGATRGGVVWLMVREAVILSAAGSIIGLLGSLAAGRAVQAELFQLHGVDPLTLSAAAAVLCAVALAAAGAPAFRAGRIEPLTALRHE